MLPCRYAARIAQQLSNAAVLDLLCYVLLLHCCCRCGSAGCNVRVACVYAMGSSMLVGFARLSRSPRRGLCLLVDAADFCVRVRYRQGRRRRLYDVKLYCLRAHHAGILGWRRGSLNHRILYTNAQHSSISIGGGFPDIVHKMVCDW